jgi:hypothetical protein
MQTIEQRFRKEIEVEQLWAVTEHGRYVFTTMLLVSMILVLGLWDSVNHNKLLAWIALLTTCLVPHINGIIHSELKEQKLWDKYYTEQPRPRTLSEKKYKTLKRASAS